jgi:hypothetical protein
MALPAAASFAKLLSHACQTKGITSIISKLCLFINDISWNNFCFSFVRFILKLPFICGLLATCQMWVPYGTPIQQTHS